MHSFYNPRANALVALFGAGALVAAALAYLSYVLFQAFVHGRVSIGKRSAHWEYYFAQDLVPAMFVLLIHLALATALLYTARECYAEYRIHRD